MDSDLFRIILLVLGAVLVLGLFAWDRLRNRPDYMRGGASRRTPRAVDDDFSDVEQELGLIEQVIRGDESDLGVGEPYVVSRRPSRRAPPPEEAPAQEPIPEPVLDETPVPGAAADTRDRAPVAEPVLPEPPPAAPEPEPERLLTVTLISRGGTFSGIRLRRAFNEAGLVFGAMSIYHFREGADTLFSVANLVVPGTFEPSSMDGFSSPGLAFFVSLPGPRDPVAAFEAMYGCVLQMASRLDGELCDARRQPLGEPGLAALRAEAARAAGR